MTSFNVTCFKKAISEIQEDSVQIPTQQKSDPLFLSERPIYVSGRSLVSRNFLTAPACIRPNDKATPSEHQSEFKKYLDFFFRHIWEDSLHRFGR
jgi:hypothetical protein